MKHLATALVTVLSGTVMIERVYLPARLLQAGTVSKRMLVESRGTSCSPGI